MTNTHRNIEKQDLYNELVEELKDKVRKLKEYGLSEKDIVSLLHSEQPSLQLTVSKDYKVFLGEKRVEVCMEPLVKAVYLLFLKHPEGIVFKDLPDYRKELAYLYDKVRPWGLTDRTLQSIEDVTNPTLNSINEKCARIKKIFLGILGSEMAEHYYIKGTRGEPKGVDLPRDLVVWE
jgi:hypothetical protein